MNEKEDIRKRLCLRLFPVRAWLRPWKLACFDILIGNLYHYNDPKRNVRTNNVTTVTVPLLFFKFLTKTKCTPPFIRVTCHKLIIETPLFTLLGLIWPWEPTLSGIWTHFILSSNIFRDDVTMTPWLPILPIFSVL